MRGWRYDACPVACPLLRLDANGVGNPAEPGEVH